MELFYSQLCVKVVSPMWLSPSPRVWRHCERCKQWSGSSGKTKLLKLQTRCSQRSDTHNTLKLATNLRRNFTITEMAPNIRKLFTFILLIFHVSKYLQETLARKICLMFERSCVYKSFELMIYLCCSLRRKIWKRTCFWGKWWIPCFFTIPGFT